MQKRINTFINSLESKERETFIKNLSRDINGSRVSNAERYYRFNLDGMRKSDQEATLKDLHAQ